MEGCNSICVADHLSSLAPARNYECEEVISNFQFLISNTMTDEKEVISNFQFLISNTMTDEKEVISNFQFLISNKMTKGKNEKIYDLEERTAIFGEAIIEFAKKIPKNVITMSLINQIVRAGTSIGANYCEADCAESKKDFEHKLGICKKEAKETKHWLRMITKAVPPCIEEAKKLWNESNELQLIFIAIVKKSRNNLGIRN